MGFFDTLAGAGRAAIGAIGELGGAALRQLGPPLLGAVAQYGVGRLLGGGGGGYQQRFPTYGDLSPSIAGGYTRAQRKLLSRGLPGGAPAYPSPPSYGAPPFVPQLRSVPSIPAPSPFPYQAPTFQQASYSPGGVTLPSFTDSRLASFNPYNLFAPTAVGGGIFDLPGFDVAVPESQTFQSGLFRAAAPTARPRSLVIAMNPVTGAPTFFKHVGAPILFSGDMAACRRVGRIARRARRRGGRFS